MQFQGVLVDALPGARKGSPDGLRALLEPAPPALEDAQPDIGPGLPEKREVNSEPVVFPRRGTALAQRADDSPPRPLVCPQCGLVRPQVCAACHGEAAKGGVAPFYPSLVGGQPLTNGIDTVKTIANYYAYPTTIFDYTRRAMPYNMPRSLTDDEVYALTAYILALNNFIGQDDVMDANTLPKVKMPNRDNFIMPYPDRL